MRTRTTPINSEFELLKCRPDSTNGFQRSVSLIVAVTRGSRAWSSKQGRRPASPQTASSSFRARATKSGCVAIAAVNKFNVARVVSDPPSIAFNTKVSPRTRDSGTGKHRFVIVQTVFYSVFIKMRCETFFRGAIFDFRQELAPVLQNVHGKRYHGIL